MDPKKHFPYRAAGSQRLRLVQSKTFDVDNGAGTTDDEAIYYAAEDCYVVSAGLIFQEATDTSGAASANVKLGTAAGGAQVVAATAIGVSKAVGAYQALTLVSGGEFLAAGSTLFVRHTGVVATEAGQYKVQALILPVP